MSTNNESKPVVVYSGNTWQAGMVKTLLEDEGIPAFLKDEHIGTIAPWQTSAGGVASVKVVVSSLDLEEAQHIVDTFQNS